MSNYRIMITLDDFIKTAVGEIYYLAPNYKPRHIEDIINGIIENFKKNAETIGITRLMYFHTVPLKHLYQFISDTLMPIDKFRELNLTQKECDAGINVDDDEIRAKIVFTSMFTEIDEEDDFIDLDACIQNIFAKYEHEVFRDWKYCESNDDASIISDLMRFRKLYKEDKETEE